MLDTRSGGVLPSRTCQRAFSQTTFSFALQWICSSVCVYFSVWNDCDTYKHTSCTHIEAEIIEKWRKKIHLLMYENLGHSMIWLIFKWNLSIRFWCCIYINTRWMRSLFREEFSSTYNIINASQPATHAITNPHTFPGVPFFLSWYPDAILQGVRADWMNLRIFSDMRNGSLYIKTHLFIIHIFNWSELSAFKARIYLCALHVQCFISLFGKILAMARN